MQFNLIKLAGVVLGLLPALAGAAAAQGTTPCDGGPICNGCASATLTVADSAPSQVPPWTKLLTVPAFDPALGELVRVEIRATAPADGRFQVENLDKAQGCPGGIWRLATALGMTFDDAGLVLFNLEKFDVNGVFGPLAPYDGVTDYDGDSGETHPFATDFHFGVCLDDASVLDEFVATMPGQQLTFTALTAGVTQTESSGCAFLQILVKLHLGINLDVTYTYCPNSPPVAQPDEAETCEGQPVDIDILANDFDPDGTLDCSSIVITVPPANGTVAISRNCTGFAPCPTCVVTYTPDPGFTGTDTFAYIVFDDMACASNEADVTVEVRARPIAVDDDAFTCQGQAVQIPVLANDFHPNGTIDCGSIVITVPPTQGTVVIGPGCTGPAPCPGCAITYTPNPTFFGIDSFQYTVQDTDGCVSNPATVEIDVSANPVAVDDGASTCEGVPVNIAILMNDFDPDGSIDCGSIVITSPPANGTVMIGGGCAGFAPCPGCVVTYTPNPGFWGPDQFGYTVQDDRGCFSNEGTVAVQVRANPVGGDDTAFTCEGDPVAIPILANDVDPDGVIDCGSIVIVVPPANGGVVIGPGCTGPAPCAGCFVTYTPNPGFTGMDGFQYTVSDTTGCVSQATPVAIQVSGRPIAMDDDDVTCVGEAVQIPILDNDVPVEGMIDCGSIVITSPPAFGTVVIGPGCTGPAPCPGCFVTYTPNPGHTGLDSFRYTVADVAGCVSNEATVTVDTSANPIAADDVAATCQGVPVNIPILANDFDPDGQIDCGSIVIVTAPANGTVTIGGGCAGSAPCPGCFVTYTPDPGFFGTDGFTYRVADLVGCLSNAATVTIDVNGSPVANDDQAETCQGHPVEIDVLANDFDPDGNIDCGSITIVTPPSNGTVTVGVGCVGQRPCPGCRVLYTPNRGYCGPDLFQYTVRDQRSCVSNVATVIVDVNCNPVGGADTAFTCQDEPVDVPVLANDIDPEGALDCGSIVIEIPPMNGTVTIGAGCTGPAPCPGCVVTYTPSLGFTGVDVFFYSVADSAGCRSMDIPVTVTVEEEPTAVDDTAVTCQGECVVIDVTANDLGMFDPSTVEIVTGPTHGTIPTIDPTTGAITYCPNAIFCDGEDTFTYRITGMADCPSDPATVRVQVNCNPIAMDDHVDKDPADPSPIPIDVLANDSGPDGIRMLDPSTVMIVEPPVHGTIIDIDPVTGVITWEMLPSFTNTDTFTYSVENNHGCIDEARVFIEVDSDCPAKEHRRRPGALLLFPEFDNRNGVVTIGSITNTKSTPGDVKVMFYYRNKLNCSKFDRTHTLTPNDNLTFVTNVHNPNQEQGYFYVYAICPTGNAPIAFNHLIGNLLVVDGIETFAYGVNPISFRGIGSVPSPNCPGFLLTDVDGDGIRDLDGIEYAMAPAEIQIPRFLGQSEDVQSQLIMIGLTGGSAFTTILDFLIYNDNEQVFSSQFLFKCWAKVPLLDISGAFSNNFLMNFTNDNPTEIVGDPSQKSGWIRIDGAVAQSTTTSILDPAFYAVLVECVDVDRCVADLPFELCVQDNGKLLPSSLTGD